MKSRLFLVTLLILISSIFLSSCRGAIGATSWPGLSVDEETLYVSYATGVFAIRIEDGNLLKRYPAEPDSKRMFYAPPIVIGDMVVVGDYAGNLSALDFRLDSQGTDVSEQWIFSDGNGRWIAAVLGLDELILAPSGNHNLYAIDMQGNKEWLFEESTESYWGQPVSDGENVYLTSMDHSLYAVKVSNGSKVWSVDFDGAMVSGPALSDDGVLYFATLSDEILAIQASNNRELFRFETEDDVWGTPVLHEDQLFFGDLSGTIYSIDAHTGSLKWKLDADNPIAGSGAVTPEGLVFTTEGGDVLMVSIDGIKQWTRSVEGKLYGDPVVGTDLIVVAITGGEQLLVAYDFKGNEEWTFTPSD